MKDFSAQNFNLIFKGISNYSIQLIDSGILDFDTWKVKIRERFEDSFLNFLGFNESETDDCINEIWRFKFDIKGENISSEEYAESKRKKNPINIVRTSIDKLFQTMDDYRKGTFFLDMLSFCANFHQLAPYNAMMVKTQMPSAKYVLNKKRWQDSYQRRPKRNARPLVVLRKYGPIDFVFEISDTEPAGHTLFSASEEEILAHLSNPYKTSGIVANDVYDRLIERLSYIGIKLEWFRVGASFGAQILKTPCKIKVRDINTDGYYVISVNDKADKSTAFASICHELGHFFCHHLLAPSSDWWNHRQLTWEQKEFEAEIVSYVICERFGVGNKSWEYLAEVIGKNGEIPDGISVDRIFKAANEVERLLDPETKPHTCLLYFNDRHFKSTYYAKYKEEISKDKNEQE